MYFLLYCWYPIIMSREWLACSPEYIYTYNIIWAWIWVAYIIIAGHYPKKLVRVLGEVRTLSAPTWRKSWNLYLTIWLKAEIKTCPDQLKGLVYMLVSCYHFVWYSQARSIDRYCDQYKCILFFFIDFYWLFIDLYRFYRFLLILGWILDRCWSILDGVLKDFGRFGADFGIDFRTPLHYLF